MNPYPQERVKPPFISIGWYGHAMFLLQDDQGRRVVTDPYDPSIGYPFPRIEADVVLVSHDHYDHNNASAVGGNPVVLRGEGRKEASGLLFEGIPTFHDHSGGSERGSNVIYRWEMGGLKVAHLGDLGHPLTTSQSERLQDLDVILVPVGGTFTIDDDEAWRLVEQLRPRMAIPMHYRTDLLSFPIKDVQPFASRFGEVVDAGRETIFLSREVLPEDTRVIVLGYLS